MLERVLCMAVVAGLLGRLAAGAPGAPPPAPLVQVEARRINAVQMHSNPLDGPDLMQVEELGGGRRRHAGHRCRGAHGLHTHHWEPASERRPARRRHAAKGTAARSAPPPRRLGGVKEPRGRLQQKLKKETQRREQLRRLEQQNLERKLEQDKLDQEKLEQNLTRNIIEQQKLEEKLEQQKLELKNLEQLKLAPEKSEQPKEKQEKAEKEKLDTLILKKLLGNSNKCQKQRDSSSLKEPEDEKLKEEECEEQEKQLRLAKKLRKQEQCLEQRVKKLQNKLSRQRQVPSEGEKEITDETTLVNPPQCSACCAQQTTERQGTSTESKCCSEQCLSSQESCCSRDCPRVGPSQTVPPLVSYPQTNAQTVLPNAPQTAAQTRNAATKMNEKEEEFSPQKLGQFLKALQPATGQTETPQNQSKVGGGSFRSISSEGASLPVDRYKLEGFAPLTNLSVPKDTGPPMNQTCPAEDSSQGNENQSHTDGDKDKSQG